MGQTAGQVRDKSMSHFHILYIAMVQFSSERAKLINLEFLRLLVEVERYASMETQGAMYVCRDSQNLITYLFSRATE